MGLEIDMGCALHAESISSGSQYGVMDLEEDPPFSCDTDVVSDDQLAYKYRLGLVPQLCEGLISSTALPHCLWYSQQILCAREEVRIKHLYYFCADGEIMICS